MAKPFYSWVLDQHHFLPAFTQRGIYYSDEDRESFLSLVDHQDDHRQMLVHGHVLMSNPYGAGLREPKSAAGANGGACGGLPLEFGGGAVWAEGWSRRSTGVSQFGGITLSRRILAH